MKINMKKTLLMSILAGLISTGVYAEDTIVYLNDGHITFDGNSANNEAVTITVTKEECSLDENTMWTNSNSEDIVYMSDTVSDSNGTYTFKLYLGENGIYNVYIGAEKSNEIKLQKIEYTNKAQNDAAITNLNQYIISGTESDVENLISQSADELRVYMDCVSDADMENVAKFVYEYMKETGEQNDTDKVKEIIEKAIITDCINNNTVGTLYQYKDNMGLDEKALGYYTEANAQEIQQFLQNGEIAGIKAFDEKIIQAIVVTGINNSDGIGVIKNILTDYSDLFGISSTNITDDLCSQIANSPDFASVDAIKSFITAYAPSTDNSQGGGYTGGGGGAISGIPGGYVENPSASQSNANVSFFDDIDDDFWAREAIETLYKKNIISGKTEALFYPQDTVKREEFVKMLVLAADFDVVNEEIPFEDVKEEDWYYEYVRSAYLAYIVNGVSETSFGAGMEITRQDLSVMILNALKTSDVVLPETREAVVFSDEENIAEYAKEAVATLQKAGVISGYDDGEFKPQGKATRAEAAYMIYKVLPYLN